MKFICGNMLECSHSTMEFMEILMSSTIFEVKEWALKYILIVFKTF